MASYTTNLNLKKPALDDDALITDINTNMDAIDTAVTADRSSLDALRDGLAIVANGDTHIAITAGQWVYVKGHNTLPEGLYTAQSNISANGALSTSNLTADSKGGLNALSDQITWKHLGDIESLNDSVTIPNGLSEIIISQQVNYENRYGVLFVRSNATTYHAITISCITKETTFYQQQNTLKLNVYAKVYDPDGNEMNTYTLHVYAK